jgi:hypothetical protein
LRIRTRQRPGEREQALVFYRELNDRDGVTRVVLADATIAGRDVGTRTTADVLDAQQRFYNAQLDLARARYDYLQGRYDYLQGRVRLASAVGELGDEDVRALNKFLY